MSLTIVTIFKPGKLWLDEYVYKLESALRRTLKTPFEFVCITDTELDVPTLPLIDFHSPSIKAWGVWYKLQMFRPENKLAGQCLYIDLDTIIKEDFSEMIFKCDGHKFLMTRDPWKAEISTSAFMYWEGDQSHIWDIFVAQPLDHWVNRYQTKDQTRLGDQGFLYEHVEHELIQTVTGDIQSISKINKKASRPWEKILFCSGRRKPWVATDHPDVQQYWK
jgi:hypothetical protein